MKKTTKFTLILFVFICMLISTSNIFSQCFSNQVGPPRTEVQSAAGLMEFTQWPLSCSGAPGTDLIGVGINQSNPQYMLDILCDPSVPTNKDINISCASCSPTDAVGYRIGGNMVMWHDGDVTSMYIGVGTGSIPYTNYHNTFVGGNVDYYAAGGSSWNNTMIGYGAGH